jgi:hypothetical protein
MRFPVCVVYFGSGPGRGIVAQASQSLSGEPAAPQTDRPRHRADKVRNRGRGAPFAGKQYDSGAQNVTLLRRRRAKPCLKHRAILRR